MTERVVVATYDYRDADRTLLYQKIRYAPKTFVQRRPNGSGGWIANREGITPVVYRLPDLKGQKAIIWGEGEGDIEAAWAVGIPAT